MAPGMGHCGGGEGPNTFDMVGALEQWVERGQAPDAILATHSSNGVKDRSRPLCAYPKVAVYTGKGSTDGGPLQFRVQGTIAAGARLDQKSAMRSETSAYFQAALNRFSVAAAAGSFFIICACHSP